MVGGRETTTHQVNTGYFEGAKIASKTGQNDLYILSHEIGSNLRGFFWRVYTVGITHLDFDSEYAKKGTVLISIVLWLTFIIPGIIYTLWRLKSRHKKCSVCGSTTLIPLDTPAGKKLLADQGKTMQQAIAEAPLPSGPTQVPLWLVWAIVGIVVVGFLTLAISYT